MSENTNSKYCNVEAEQILNRRRSSDNQTEAVSWLNISLNIVKSYRDGFISNQDIDRRENFLNYFYNRESMLVSVLGLLEKNNDPQTRAQMDVLKNNLSLLRVCRATLLKNTPPKNIAKRIQQRQMEEKKKQESLSANSRGENGAGAAMAMLLDEDPNTKKKPTPAEAVFSSLMLMHLAKGLPQEDLKNLIENNNLVLNPDNPLVENLQNAITELRNCGVSDKEIEQISRQNPDNPEIFAKLERRFYPQDSKNISNTNTSEDAQSFYLQLEESIRRYDVANNVYDSSLVDQLISNRMQNGQISENSLSVDGNDKKNRIIMTLEKKLATQRGLS